MISVPMMLPDGTTPDPLAGQNRRAMTRRTENDLRKALASFESGMNTPEMVSHFRYANGSDADAAADSMARANLRNRCRYESMNNGFVRGMLSTLADHVVSTGPRMHLPFLDRSQRRQSVSVWQEWADEVNLTETLRIARISRAESGEVFVLLTRNDSLESPIKLHPRLVEADQVATPGMWFNDQVVDGMRLGADGQVLEYHLLRHHPGTKRHIVGLPTDFDRIPASYMLHWAWLTRPGQHRGVPEFSSTLPIWAAWRRFLYATLAAAETAADFAAVLMSREPAIGGEGDVPQPMDLMELTQRMATVLPAGYELGQVRAEHPQTTIRDFQHAVITQAARIWNMPYSVAIGDSSESNFASARLDHKPYFFARKIEQQSLENTILRPIARRWIAEGSLIEGLLPQGLRSIHTGRISWLWGTQDDHEPRERAVAQQMGLELSTTTLSHELAAKGMDWEEVIEQRAKERDMLKRLGLETDHAPGTGSGTVPEREEAES